VVRIVVGMAPLALPDVTGASCTPPPPGLIAWWPGDGDCRDVVGTRVGVVNGGVTFTSGKVGQAFNFNGVNGTVTFPGSEYLNPQAGVSMEMWVKTTTPKGWAGLLLKMDYAPTNGGPFKAGYKMNLSRDGYGVEMWFPFGYTTNGLYTGNPKPVVDGYWHHVVGTYDGTKALVYVDGLPGPPAFGTGWLNPSATPVILGNDNCCGNDPITYDRFFEGSLDEVSIYDRALSASEVAALYAAGSAGKCEPACAPPPPGLMAWWPGDGNFQDLAGTTVGVVNGGVSFASGKVGQAFTFNGVNGTVTFPGSENLNPQAGVSMEMWIKAIKPKCWAGLLLKMDYPQTNGRLGGYKMNLSTNGYGVEAWFPFGNWPYAGNPKPVVDGYWHHVVGTYDGTKALVYVDGLPGPPTFGTGWLTPSATPVILGNDNCITNRFFEGSLDEVCIYNRALSASEVAALYAAGSAGKCEPARAPNLTPYAPSGWSDKIVVSRTKGNTTDSTGLTIGDSLYVDWAVLNNGNAAATSLFYTELYLDGVLKQTWSTPPPLNANYYAPVFDYPIGSLSAGTHTLRIKTDSTGAISESNESDNEYSKTISVGNTSLPDLVITSISLSPSSPQPGQAYTAYVTLKNQGSGSGAANWLDVWANQPSSQSCGANGDTWTSVGVLTASQSKTFTFSMAAPASAGNYTFRAFVDSACLTAESNDSNNQSTLAYTVSQAGQLPDFRVTAISLSPSSPQPGQAVTAYVTVKNQGTGAGDGGWLDIWANQSSPAACGASGTTWAAVGALSVGQSKTLSLSLTAPASAGSYTCRAFVDSVCQTPESAEGNNQTTLTYTVATASALPDFIVSSISFNPAQPIAGQPFTAYVTVKNQGAGPGDAKYLDVWVNQASPQSCGASGNQYQTVGILAAGQSTTKTYNVTAPASGAPWIFRAFVDSGCQTTEANDGNNQTTVSYGANPVAQPDFLITSISLSPSNLKPGDKFTAFVTVKNQGTGSGDAGWLDVWANHPAPAACSDPGDSYAAVGVLSPGQSKTITVANLTALAGNNTLRAFVDSTCQTTETSEANNQSTYSYVAGQRVLLLLHGMNSDPYTPWNEFVKIRFNNSAPVIRGGVCWACPIADANGVVCYRIAFGSYDLTSGRTGVAPTSGPPLSAANDPHKDQYGAEGGDYSTFDTLGLEVWEAVNYILSVYPSAQVTLLGHSRGGIAARAFLQMAASSPEKASVVALLTTGTPHKGSRLARAYAYLQNDLDTHQQQENDIDSWQVVDFLRGVIKCDYIKWNDTPIDVRRPTISDLADNNPQSIETLNNNIQNLPSNVKYGSLTYAGTDLGILKPTPTYLHLPGVNPYYSVFDQQGGDICDQLSSAATTSILGDGQTPATYAGDGIVDITSQRYDDIGGFPSGAFYLSFPYSNVLHTEEPKQELHITPALNHLVTWWQ